MAHNNVCDYYRAAGKKKLVDIDGLPDLEDSTTPPSVDIDRRHLFEELFVVIQELPPRQAEIIVMRFFSGMKNKEIAAALGIKERTVAAGLCRALEKMKNNPRSGSILDAFAL